MYVPIIQEARVAMSNIRVIIVDDHALVREGIQSMLEGTEGIEIIGTADNGDNALKLFAHTETDIALVDINMPGMNGIELSEKIRDQFPKFKVIILSMDVTISFVKKAIQAGVRGYIPKDSQKEVLIEAIRKVHEGDKFFSEQVSKVILQGFYDEKDGSDSKKSDVLSKREEEVLKHIASGLSNREIADQLFISIRTVDAHRNHILQKLKLKSTAELVKYAIKNQIIELD